MPNIGYGSDKKTRHYLPNGFKKFLVHNVQELELLMMHNRFAFYVFCYFLAPSLYVPCEIFLPACFNSFQNFTYYVIVISGLTVLRQLIMYQLRKEKKLQSEQHSWMLLLPTSWPGCVVKRMSKPFSRLVMFLDIMHFFFNISEQMLESNCSLEIFLSFFFVALWCNLFSPVTYFI